MSFITIFEQLCKLKRNQLHLKPIKESLNGPLLPHDEGKDGGSIHARNFLFEIELAARLQARGVSIISFDDIEFDFEGTIVNVQCKRLHSSTRVQDNLDKVCEQIAKRISDTKKRGIIAVGMGKIF